MVPGLAVDRSCRRERLGRDVTAGLVWTALLVPLVEELEQRGVRLVAELTEPVRATLRWYEPAEQPDDSRFRPTIEEAVSDDVHTFRKAAWRPRPRATEIDREAQ